MFKRVEGIYFEYGTIFLIMLIDTIISLLSFAFFAFRIFVFIFYILQRYFFCRSSCSLFYVLYLKIPEKVNKFHSVTHSFILSSVRPARNCRGRTITFGLS